jgi:hypothetical protein
MKEKHSNENIITHTVARFVAQAITDQVDKKTIIKQTETEIEIRLKPVHIDVATLKASVGKKRNHESEVADDIQYSFADNEIDLHATDEKMVSAPNALLMTRPTTFPRLFTRYVGTLAMIKTVPLKGVSWLVGAKMRSRKRALSTLSHDFLQNPQRKFPKLYRDLCVFRDDGHEI